MFFLSRNVRRNNEATEAAQQSFSVEVKVSIRVDIFFFHFHYSVFRRHLKGSPHKIIKFVVIKRKEDSLYFLKIFFLSSSFMLEILAVKFFGSRF